MLLSIIILIVVGLVAYFHYVQGFFSATISAIIAIISAALAVSLHEPVVTGLLGGKFADVAPGMALVVLFAVIYIILRTVADSFVPGNLRVPVLADKIGAGVMGIIAGLFAGGIVALAAQSLPFGASVGMFSRFETNAQRDVQLPTSGQAQDTFVYDELKDPDIEKNRSDDRHALWVPADEIVLGTVQRLSNEGSLAGARPLATIHPDMTEELFLSNVGIQIGAKRSAINTDKAQQVKVPAFFTVPSLPQAEGEISQIRKRNLPATLTPRPTDMILVVRVMFDRQSTDSDNKTRFSMGACRLVAGQKNYYPVGTLEKGKTLFANSLDDFLVCESEKGADLVYVIPKADLLSDPKGTKLTVADGVFVEVKRLARVDLADKKIATGVTPSDQVQVDRKPQVVKAAGETVAAAGGKAADSGEVVAAGPLAFDGAEADGKLPHPVSTGTADKTTNSFQTASATGALAEGKFSKLEVNGTESVQRMGGGSYPIDELAPAAGQKVVKAHFTIAGDNPWAFENQLAQYALVDDKGQKHAPHGAVATLKTSSGGDNMVARYNAASNVADVPHAEGRPTDVWVFFSVPAGTHVKNVTFGGKNIGAADVTVE